MLGDCLFSCFFFYCYSDHRDLHSFPTRRSSDLIGGMAPPYDTLDLPRLRLRASAAAGLSLHDPIGFGALADRKSTRLNSSHTVISYAVFCLKKKKTTKKII